MSTASAIATLARTYGVTALPDPAQAAEEVAAARAALTALLADAERVLGWERADDLRTAVGELVRALGAEHAAGLLALAHAMLGGVPGVVLPLSLYAAA